MKLSSNYQSVIALFLIVVLCSCRESDVPEAGNRVLRNVVGGLEIKKGTYGAGVLFKKDGDFVEPNFLLWSFDPGGSSLCFDGCSLPVQRAYLFFA